MLFASAAANAAADLIFASGHRCPAEVINFTVHPYLACLMLPYVGASPQAKSPTREARCTPPTPHRWGFLLMPYGRAAFRWR